MALTYTYTDAALRRHVTEDVETRATEDIARMAGAKVFSAEWLEVLITTQAYIITCREDQEREGDIFELKLKTYTDKLRTDYPRAVLDADATADVPSRAYTFKVRRA